MELRPGYKQTEVGVIPVDWNVHRLVNMARKITDGEHVTPKRTKNGYYLLSARNILNGKIEVEDVDFVGKDEFERIRRRCDPDSGDILISCSGTIGRVAVVPPAFECVLVRSAALVKLIPSAFDPVFVQFYLQGDRAQKQISNSVNQGAQPNLFLGQIENLFCAAPLISEQRTIATALSEVDALLAKLDQLLAKKRDLKLAAMQELLTGKIRLPGFGDAWKVVEFGDVAVIRNSKVMPSSAIAGTRCVELESLSQGTGQLLASFELSGASSKYSFKKGDVLFGRLRAYLKKYWLAEFDGICSTEIWPLVPRDERIHMAYLHLLVQTNDFAEAAGVSYGTHMPRSDWSILRKLEVRLPAVPEQLAIARMFSDMDVELTALGAQREKINLLKQGMMQQLLTGRIRLI